MKNIRDQLNRLRFTNFVPLQDCKPVFYLNANKSISEQHTDEIPSDADNIVFDTENSMWEDGSDETKFAVLRSSKNLGQQLSFLVEPGYVNLMPTGSFDTSGDVAAWGVTAGTKSLNTSGQLKGAGCVEFTASGSGDFLRKQYNFIGGEVYTVSLYAKVVSGTASITDFLNVENVLIEITSPPDAELTENYQRFSFTFIIDTTGNEYVKIKGSAGKAILIDNLMITKTTVPVTYLTKEKKDSNWFYRIENMLNKNIVTVLLFFRINDYEDNTNHVIYELVNDAGEHIRVGYNYSTMLLSLNIVNQFNETITVAGTHSALIIDRWYGLALQFNPNSKYFTWALLDYTLKQFGQINSFEAQLSSFPDLTSAIFSIGNAYGEVEGQSILFNQIYITDADLPIDEIKSWLLSTAYPYSIQEAIQYTIAKEMNSLSKLMDGTVISDPELLRMLSEKLLYPDILPWCDGTTRSGFYYPTNLERAQNYYDTLTKRGSITGLLEELKILSNDPTATITQVDTEWFINNVFPLEEDIYAGLDYLFVANFTNNTLSGGKFIPDNIIIKYLNDRVTPVYIKLIKGS